ncbi:hypothetical protein, partial [Mycobacterium gordonae]|uniref:hypothetical protein n=1 Tax=Mycobacterium gordonae TaxID=1778 RepID=UPI001560BF5B
MSSFVTRGVALLSGNDCHGESDAAAAGFGLGKSAQAGAAGEQRHEHQHGFHVAWSAPVLVFGLQPADAGLGALAEPETAAAAAGFAVAVV